MLKHLFAAACALLPLLSVAQSLTPAQRDTVRLFACADVAVARPMVLAGDTTQLRPWLNALGTYVAWRTRVSNDELGDAMNGTELIGLTSIKLQSLQVLSAYSGGDQNMSRADRRAAFDGVFSAAGGVVTRASMATLWKRSTTRAEQALSTGLGTTAVPGLTTFEGPVSEVSTAQMLFTDSGVLIGC